jgi:phage baseplate assembly protein W
MNISNNQTITSKIGLLYSDFTDNFDKSPFSDDLAKVTNENSVKQSLKNIVRTILGERLYDNTIGQSGNYGLFGLNDGLTQTVVSQTLTDAIKQNEPRVNLLGITVDSTSIEYALSITIYFMVINNPNTLSTNIIIKRVR